MAQFVAGYSTQAAADAAVAALDPLARPEIRLDPNEASLIYEVWILGSSAERNDVDGLRCTRPSASTIQIAVGSCRDSRDEVDIVVSTPITVDITVSGANGLDTGAEAANTWYQVFVCYRPPGGNPDDSAQSEAVCGILSTGVTAPTLPAGYTHYRRIWAVRNNAASNLIPFVAIGQGRERTCLHDVSALQVLAAGTATAWTSIALGGYVPPWATFGSFTVSCNVTAGSDFRPGGASAMTVQYRCQANTAQGRVERIPFGSGLDIEYQNTAVGGSTNVYLISWGASL